MSNVINKIVEKLNRTPLIKRVTSAITFGVGGAVGSRILTMIAGIIVSRILGSEVYGQFSLVNSTVSTFVTFSGLGIGATLTRYVTLYREDNHKLGLIVKTLSTFCGVLSFVLAVITFVIPGFDIFTET
jgi:O-antigen/teichoic acid export membrane protein